MKKLNNKNFKALYSKNLECTKKLILQKVKNYDIVLMMGAGDIDQIAREITKHQIPNSK